MVQENEIVLSIEAVSDAQKALRKVSKELKAMGGQAEKTSKKTQKSTKKIDKGFKGLNKTTSSFFKDFKKDALRFGTAFLAFDAAAGFISNATNAAGEFDKQMRRVNTVNNLSEKQFREQSKAVRDTAKIFLRSSAEIVEAQFQIASAGFDANEQLQILSVSSAAAAAGYTDTSTIVAGLSAVLKGFGIETTETTSILDKLFVVNKLGQTSIEDLSVSLQNVATNANTAGVTVDEMLAVFAVATGVTGNASKVSTQLAAVINSLVSPTDESKKKFDELGISVGRAAIEEEGFGNVIKSVIDAVDGDREALRKLIPREEAVLLLTALGTTQWGKYQDALVEVTEASGDTKRALEQFVSSDAFELEAARKELEDFSISAGKFFTGTIANALKYERGMRATNNSIVNSFQLGANEIGNFLGIVSDAESKATKQSLLARRNVLREIAEDPGKSKRDAVIKQYEKDAGLLSNTTKTAKEELEDAIKDQKDSLLGLSEALKDTKGGFTDMSSNAEKEIDDLAKAEKKAQKEIEESKKEAEKSQKERERAQKKADKERTKAAKEELKLAKEKEKAAKKLVKIAEMEAKALDKSYQKQQKTIQDVVSAHVKGTIKIVGEIQEIREELSKLEGDYKSAAAEASTGLAQAFVSQEKKVKSLREELKGTSDSSDRRDIQKRIKEEEQALRNFQATTSGIDEEINEERRRDSLTDFERTVEDIKKKETLAKKEFETQKMLLEGQILNQEIALQKEVDLFAEKRNQYEITDLAFQDFAFNFKNNLSGMVNKTEESVSKIRSFLSQMHEGGGLNAYISRAQTSATMQSSPGGAGSTSVINVGSTNINVSNTNVRNGADAKQVADMAINGITRQLERKVTGTI
jgi:TP901 family phage tail tape measure protein